MKKFLSVLLVTVIIVSVFASCGKNTTDEKIGFAAADATHGWVAGVSYYAEKYCNENGIEYKLTTSKNSEEMEKNLEELVEWGAKAVVVWPQWSGMEDAVSSVIEKGVPVVSFDIDINCNDIYKVMGNNYDLGYQCAQYITEKVGRSATVAVMEIPSAGSVSQMRKQGFYDYIEDGDYKDLKIINVEEAAFSREDGYKDMKRILAEHEKKGSPISLEQIQKAVSDLYGSWDSISESSRNFIMNAMDDGHFIDLYMKTVAGEKETKELLVEFEKKYPGKTKEANVDSIAENLQKKTNRASILADLRKKKNDNDSN